MSAAVSIDGSGKGYVRLYRKMLDNPLFTDKPAGWFKIWIFILLRANWQETVFYPRQGEPLTVPPGSLVTSLEKLGTHASLSKEHARRCLDYLERTHAVTLRRTHHWTMITIVNWATYQRSADELQHAEHHAAHHGEREDATRQTPRHPPRSATPSKEDKNSNTKYTSNSDELDSIPGQLSSTLLRASPNKRSGIDPAIQEWFDGQFWPVYPRHEGKQKALGAAVSKATTPERRAYYLARLQAQLPEYNRRKQESGQRVIPLASTWFSQDRSEDELTLPPEPAGRGQGAARQNDYPEYIPLSAEAV
jgi:hypothetical protein